jgi:WD40 repeat protein
MVELRAVLGSDLQTAVDALDASARLVYVIDQFEEVFTQCRDEDERGAFVDELTDAADARPDRLAVILTIRGDFYGRCGDHPELARLLAANQVLVGAMGRDELRRAVELPARRVGLRVESALADALVEEVADEPGGLPLLSTALVELWQAREGGWLRLESHERTGGVHGAVARLAEAGFEHLDTPQREAARAIFLRLTATGDGEAVTRRRVPVSEFDVDRNPVMAIVLTRLTDDRLLTRSDSTVEVAHEALLREWPRLQGWLAEDVQGRMLRQQVTQAAREWEGTGREQSGLYRGARLSAAFDWSTRHGRELNELEREFLGASRAADEREAERQRRTNRRLRGLLAGVAVFLVVALVAGGLALVQRSHARRAATQAEHAATAADAQRLGAQAQVQKDLDLSLLLARVGADLDDSVATRSNLLAALLRSPAAIHVLHPLPGRLLSVATSPDGRTLLVGNNEGRFGLLDARTHRVTHEFAADAASFSGDGTRVASIDTHGDPTKPVQIRVRDVSTGAASNLGRIPATIAAGQIVSPVFTPDLDRIVIAYASSPFPDPTTPAKAVVFDARTMRPIAQLTSARHSIEGLAMSPDGQDIAVVQALATNDSASRLISVWRMSDLHRPLVAVRVRHGFTHSLGFSYDDSSLVAGSEDGSVYTVSIPDGHVLTFHGRHNSSVQGVGFTPDDRTIVSTGDDSQVLVWGARTGQLTHTLTGENGRIFGPAFSPDGGTVYTDGLDGALFEWDLSGRRSLGRISTVGTPTPDPSQFTIAASPDGRYLAFLGANGTFLIRDARMLRLRRTIRTGLGDGLAVAFGPDSRLMATETHLGDVESIPSRGYRVALWDASDGAHVADLPGPARWVTVGGQRFPNDVETLAFDDRGTLLAGGDDTGHVFLWNVRTHRPTGAPLVVPPDPAVDFNGVLGVAWGPDDRLLAVAHGSVASVWSFAQHRWLYTVDVDGGFGRSKAVAFSPDGRLLVTGGGTGVVEFWDARTGKPSAANPGGSFGRTLHANDCWIDSLGFSPDGRTLLASGCDGSARLYDVASRDEIGTPLQGPGNVHNESVFSADGQRVIVHYSDGTAYIWDVSPGSWKQRACSVASRSLTVSEWQQFLPGRPYRNVCRI